MNNQLNNINGGQVVTKKSDIPHRFRRQYAGVGMCLGVCIGAAVFGANLGLTLPLGLGGGFLIGAVAGMIKDWLLYRKRARISRMEPVAGSTDLVVFTVDGRNSEAAYRMTRESVEKNRLAVGDIVSDSGGALISLEDKKKNKYKQ